MNAVSSNTISIDEIIGPRTRPPVTYNGKTVTPSTSPKEKSALLSSIYHDDRDRWEAELDAIQAKTEETLARAAKIRAETVSASRKLDAMHSDIRRILVLAGVKLQ